MQARNFFRRAVPLLTLEERELLEDWEFVLCDMDSLRNSVAFVSLRDRCFKHVEALVNQRRDAIQKIGAQTLQVALLSRHMLQWPMSTFARVFLQRYMDDLDAQQISVVSGWEEKLCSLSAAAREAASKSRAEALVEVEVFFAKHASEIVQLQKPSLQEVVTSNQAKKYPEWKHAQNFWVRHFGGLSVEQKELLEDWEFVLCDTSTLEAVAFLPSLQRCFGRVRQFFIEQREELQQQKKQALVSILESMEVESHPMASFCALFLTRYVQRFSAEQASEVAGWERDLLSLIHI